MAQSEPIEIAEDQDVAGILCGMFGSKELRALASNAGVSRERGDTKGETAQKLVAQDPALAARILENDREVDTSCEEFRERREAGADTISLEEAQRRARHRKMRFKLESLGRATAGLTMYDVEVDWEYGGEATEEGYEPGLTSITVKPDEGSEMHPLVEGRAHIILTPGGKCTHLDAADKQYISSRNEGQPRRKWRLAMSRIESFYDSEE